ncbi:hypothetical protein CLV86_0479 [Lacinutrix venerupis]|nr:hypothetical protein CLV86_0479 [Lacinutrix venerupis]
MFVKEILKIKAKEKLNIFYKLLINKLLFFIDFYLTIFDGTSVKLYNTFVNSN